MKNISFRVDDETHKLMQAVADHAFLPMATMLRHLVVQYARDNKLIGCEQDNKATPVAKATELQLPKNDAGDLDVRIFLAKCRSLYRDGKNKHDICKAYGIDNRFIDDAVHKWARIGNTSAYMPWHTDREKVGLDVISNAYKQEKLEDLGLSFD